MLIKKFIETYWTEFQFKMKHYLAKSDHAKQKLLLQQNQVSLNDEKGNEKGNQWTILYTSFLSTVS